MAPHAPSRTALLTLSLATGSVLGGGALLVGGLPWLSEIDGWLRGALAALMLGGAAALAVALQLRHRSTGPAALGAGLLVIGDLAALYAVGTSLDPSRPAGLVVALATYAVVFAVLGLHLATLQVLRGDPVSSAGSGGSAASRDHRLRLLGRELLLGLPTTDRLGVGPGVAAPVDRGQHDTVAAGVQQRH